LLVSLLDTGLTKDWLFPEFEWNAIECAKTIPHLADRLAHQGDRPRMFQASRLRLNLDDTTSRPSSGFEKHWR
jgi:hypothetical protein